MPNSHLHRLLIALFLTIAPSQAQSLFDVVASLSDRQRVLDQRSQVRIQMYNQHNDPDSAFPFDEPIDWHVVGANPTETSLDALEIGDRIAILTQAAQEFERLKFEFLNSSDAEYSAGSTVGTLQSYSDSDFDPLPRATLDNYHQLLRLLAQRIRALQLIRWPSAFHKTSMTQSGSAAETVAYDDPQDENDDDDLEPYMKLMPEGVTVSWKPATFGPSVFHTETSTQETYVLSDITARVSVSHGNYTVSYSDVLEQDLRSQGVVMQLAYPESADLATTAQGASGNQIEGEVFILRRGEWNKLSMTGAHTHFDKNQAGHVVVGSGSSGSITLFSSSPVPSINGTWATSPFSDTEGFFPTGYTFKKSDYEQGTDDHPFSYEANWAIGCSFASVFKPVFTRGVDTPAMRTKLEAAAAFLADNSADGKFLLNPRPGLLFGIELGPGLKGFGNGYVTCGTPRGPRDGSDALHRFDSTYSLQFAGSCSDYHVVYENDRSTRIQSLPGMGFHRPDYYYKDDNWTLYDAWDSPRLKQIVGRDLVADVEYNGNHYGGYTVRIYRRPTGTSQPAPGQVLSLTGLTLVRTWTFSHQGGSTAHPTDAEKLEVAGGGDEKYEITANHILGELEWDHWQWGPYWIAYPTHEGWWESYMNEPFWLSYYWIGGSNTSWSWTLKALDGTSEKYRKEIGINIQPAQGEPKATVSEHLDGQLISTLSSMTLDPFTDHIPSDWEITADEKTISGTAVLGDLYEPATGYGKWPISVSVEYDGIAPDLEITWDSKGLLASQTQGPWSTTGTATGNTYTLTQEFDSSTVGTTWIELLSGNKVKTYSAPDGNAAGKTATEVAWSEIEYGTATTGLPGLPHKLTRIDGSGVQWTWAPAATGQTGTLTAESGQFSGSSLTTGSRQATEWNERGHTTESDTEFIAGGTVTVASASVPSGQLTAWGTPKEWKDLFSGRSTLVTHDGGLNRPESITSPLGVTTDYSDYDAFNRPGQVVSNGITANNTFTGLGVSTSYSGTGVTAGSQSSFTRNAFGTSVTNDLTWGGVDQSQEVEHGATSTTITGENSLLGSSEATIRNDDNSISAADSPTLAFGGVTGDPLSVSNGLFVTKTEVAGLPGSFAETHTDAWGRTHKIVTPSKSGGSTQTTFDYSLPGNALKRIITNEPTGRVLITESDEYGTITRSGIDVNGNGFLGASDRYTESITEVVSGKVVTTLNITEDSGKREVMESKWTPSSGTTVTKINGNEETITSTPDYSAKTVTTSSTKGWSRSTSINNHGLATTNTLSGTGIPTTSLTPTWRADGSLESVSLSRAGETHSAAFNPDGTLSSLTAPGRGNILGGHSISNGVETLTVDGVTTELALDGTGKSIGGANVINQDEALTTAGGGYRKTVTPAVGAPTETTFNAAAAPTAKTYADSSGESYGYSGELLTSVLLARGSAMSLGYSNDGAKDLISAGWPAMASGPFAVPGIAQGYAYNRSGKTSAVVDPSGTRTLAYQNGRLSGSTYTAGFLKGYETVTARDAYGRHTGTVLKRDGTTIHSTQKTPNGASDQITNLASGNITSTPQRDGAGNITGYVWSDGSNTVTQTWTRGAGGRIESAGSDVSGAPTFNYAVDANSFDAFGRRLKSQTEGGTWTYVYGAGGQLTSATHPTLGTFNYAFDGIGRRTDMGAANITDVMNRTTAWTNSAAKTLTINAHSNARVWFNGTEIPNFTGQHQAALGTPGASGEWVPWETLAVLEGQGEGAGSPPANPLASPDAKAEKRGAAWIPPAAETLTYDAAGNRESSAQWDYGWDAKNQLTRARTKNHTAAPQAYDLTFTCDSEGRRVKKHVIEYASGAIVSEKTITFVWDGWDLLYERHQLPSGLTTLERKYLWGPDIADGAAGGAGGLLLIRETKGSTTTEIIPLYDGTGHVTALANLNKDLLATYAYGPFGEKISATGSLANGNPWRYATKYLDEETGLYYFGKRYLDPITGQFLSREPLGEAESLNLYQYGHGDPINNLDVQGLATVAVDGGLSTSLDSVFGILTNDSIPERESTATVPSEPAYIKDLKWLAYFRDYVEANAPPMPGIDGRHDFLRKPSAAQRRALAEMENSPMSKLGDLFAGIVGLPGEVGAFAINTVTMADITSAPVEYDLESGGFHLGEERSGGEKIAMALLVAVPEVRGGFLVDDVGRLGMRSTMPRGSLQRVSVLGTYLPHNGKTYVQFAEEIGARRFALPDEKFMSLVQRAESVHGNPLHYNQLYLDSIVKRGDLVRLNISFPEMQAIIQSNPNAFKTLRWEIDDLLGRGYTWGDDLKSLIPSTR